MPRSRYYSRDGKPLTLIEWAKNLERRSDSGRRVAEATVPGNFWVSTVWLGVDHNYRRSGPPQIFETMVFRSHKELHEFDCVRYTTETQALNGHIILVKKWSQWWRDEDKWELLKKS